VNPSSHIRTWPTGMGSAKKKARKEDRKFAMAAAPGSPAASKAVERRFGTTSIDHVVPSSAVPVVSEEPNGIAAALKLVLVPLSVGGCLGLLLSRPNAEDIPPPDAARGSGGDAALLFMIVATASATVGILVVKFEQAHRLANDPGTKLLIKMIQFFIVFLAVVVLVPLLLPLFPSIAKQ